MTVRIIRHSIVPDTGSFEVRTPSGSTYFYWDDIPSRRLRPEQVDQETAKKQAQEFARKAKPPES
ncbi:hypothetical protein [Bradyrhizobium sp. Arg816]|uniref:hypothetical protein n=1 Tax=Bradyrhizobium sp. Arg816 TaxID=2998491 RepID=UPI00249DC9D9|nr:hypothetical protein [Bradyrhizobium sp. Arg816]MDI3563573.1 hypothetical protein [Bradyrhizobium sp. Arg816]